MARRRALLLLAAAASTLVGCRDEGPTPSAQDFAGRWRSVIDGTPCPVVVTLDLQQSGDGRLSGPAWVVRDCEPDQLSQDEDAHEYGAPGSVDGLRLPLALRPTAYDITGADWSERLTLTHEGGARLRGTFEAPSPAGLGGPYTFARVTAPR